MSPREQVVFFYERVWNARDESAVARVLHPDVTFRGSLGTAVQGREAFADYVRQVTTALDSYRCTIDELVVDQQLAAARMTFAGTHVGELLGVPATGRQVSWAGAAFFSFDGDLVRDLWVLGDLDHLRRQL